jgi:hypothetical protein
MRHKMVNLDSTSHEYASKMSNFSAFVRECILNHSKEEDTPYLKEQVEQLKKLLDDVKNGRRVWDGATWLVVE